MTSWYVQEKPFQPSVNTECLRYLCLFTSCATVTAPFILQLFPFHPHVTPLMYTDGYLYPPATYDILWGPASDRYLWVLASQWNAIYSRVYLHPDTNLGKNVIITKSSDRTKNIFKHNKNHHSHSTSQHVTSTPTYIITVTYTLGICSTSLPSISI